MQVQKLVPFKKSYLLLSLNITSSMAMPTATAIKIPVFTPALKRLPSAEQEHKVVINKAIIKFLNCK